jgi:hypothetical protein
VEYVSLHSTPPATEGGSPRPAAGPSATALARQIAALKAEIARLKAQSQSPQGGSDPQTSASPTQVLETTSTQPVVTVDLPATVQREAAVGERVTVEMPTGETVDGTVTTVSPVASTTPSSGGQSGDNGNDGGSGGANATIPVTVTLHGRHAVAHLDQATVTVNFARAQARHVLSVPVTALLATGGGRYVLENADPPHALIRVSTGLFAAGYVQVSGPRVHAGLRVTDSQG